MEVELSTSGVTRKLRESCSLKAEDGSSRLRARDAKGRRQSTVRLSMF